MSKKFKRKAIVRPTAAEDKAIVRSVLKNICF